MNATISRNGAILPAVVGDPVRLDGYRSHVKIACEATPREYVCTTCSQILANRHQVDLHVDDGHRHVIARLCGLHGPEEVDL